MEGLSPTEEVLADILSPDALRLEGLDVGQVAVPELVCIEPNLDY